MATPKDILDKLDRINKGEDDNSLSKRFISHFASQDGSGVTLSAIGNYSDGGLGVTHFIVQPPADEVWRISRMHVQVRDTGVLDSGLYGDGITLTNGISLFHNSEQHATNVLTPRPVTTNGGWGEYCYDVSRTNFGGGDEFLQVRWTFRNSGTRLRLDGSLGDQLVVELNDDFSGLVDHTFLFKGFVE